jgi:hypothetical protein
MVNLTTPSDMVNLMACDMVNQTAPRHCNQLLMTSRIKQKAFMLFCLDTMVNLNGF